MPERESKIPLSIRDLGLCEYRKTLELQKELLEERFRSEIANTVLLVEHPPVITLGARELDNKLLIDNNSIKQKGIDLIQIRRGGAATAHNPGQLVLYPIIDLRSVNLGINEYIRTLEAIGIELLETVKVTTNRKKGFPGLWTQTKKIASIGVRVSRGITYHGMAININNDLAIFDCIVPCGLDGVVMTSAKKNLGKNCDMTELKSQAAEIFKKHFTGN